MRIGVDPPKKGNERPEAGPVPDMAKLLPYILPNGYDIAGHCGRSIHDCHSFLRLKALSKARASFFEHP